MLTGIRLLANNAYLHYPAKFCNSYCLSISLWKLCYGRLGQYDLESVSKWHREGSTDVEFRSFSCLLTLFCVSLTQKWVSSPCVPRFRSILTQGFEQHQKQRYFRQNIVKDRFPQWPSLQRCVQICKRLFSTSLMVFKA